MANWKIKDNKYNYLGIPINSNEPLEQKSNHDEEKQHLWALKYNYNEEMGKYLPMVVDS